MKRVGIWFQPKKWKKFRLEEFVLKCREDGLEVVQIDLTRDIEYQGPFDAVMHKIVNTMKDAEIGDSQAQESIERYERYLKNHPEVLVFDSLDACRKIIDRGQQFRIAQKCEQEIGEDAHFFVPSFVDIRHECSQEELKNILRDGGIKYPFLTKCVDAQALDHCHQMSLVFNEDGLNEVKTPCIIQNFVNHSATLFKMFCLCEQFFVVGRKSIKNFNESNKNNKTTFFDSRDISKENSHSKLTEESCSTAKPDMERFAKLAQVFRKVTQMEFFGVDFCVEDGTGRYAAVDINVFPGFDGVPDLHTLLKDFLLKKISEKSNTSS